MERFVNFLIKFRFLVLIIFIIIFIFFAYQLKNYSIDNSLNTWFLENDENLKSYNEFKEIFGNDETISIAIITKDEILKNRELLMAVEESLIKINGIRQVYTYNNTKLKNLISKDKKSSIVMALPEKYNDEAKDRSKILSNINKSLSELEKKYDFSYKMAGIGVMYEELNNLSARDSFIFSFFSFLLIFILLIIFIRKKYFIIFALIIIFLSLTVGMGFMFLMKGSINLVSMVIPALITIYSISDIIHIINNFKRSYKTGNKKESIIIAIKESYLPCFLTSLTTAIGFMALYFSKIKLLRDFALFSAISIMVEYFITIILLPVMFYFMPEKEIISEERKIEISYLDNLYTFISKNSKKVILSSIFLMIIFLCGIFLINVDTYTIKFLKKSNKVRSDSEFIEKNFGFYTPLEILLYGEKDHFLKRENVIHISNFEDNVLKNPNIDNVISPYRLVPYFKTVDDITILKTLLEKDRFFKDVTLQYFNNDYSLMRLTFMTKMLSAKEYKKIIAFIKQEAKDLKEKGINIKFSGYLPLYVEIISYVTHSQISSFLIAFIIVFLIIMLYAREINLAIYAVIANIFPLIITLGLMGFLRIRLDVATVTIAAIALGISVDDTIHFLYKFKKEKSLFKTINETGNSIIQTSLIFIIGLLVLLFSSVNSLVFFGLLIIIYFILALIGDIIILPSLIYNNKAKNETKYIC
ncbi:MAG TPA: MMPL family transporter [Spirochaetota bacterium]|nr:MMPL family transporter [Spirochaetota bacterium]HOL56094.1 MMPL family transporter [Spirochaetota bacterium]HPP03492.1 MMPL family transporter [Spirochaetota bacterium]